MRSTRRLATLFLLSSVSLFLVFASVGGCFSRPNTMILLRTDDEKEAGRIFLQLKREGFQSAIVLPPSVAIGYLSASDEEKIRLKLGEAIECLTHEEVDPHVYDRRGSWTVTAVYVWNEGFTETAIKKHEAYLKTLPKNLPPAPINDVMPNSSTEMQQREQEGLKDRKILYLLGGDLDPIVGGRRRMEDDEVGFVFPKQPETCRLEISVDESFVSPLISTVCVGGIVVPKCVLKPGRPYFWRFRRGKGSEPAYSLGKLDWGWSDIQRVQVGDSYRNAGRKGVERGDRAIEAPRLLSPDDNATMKEESVRISWRRARGAKFYRVQIAEDRRFMHMFIDRFFRVDNLVDTESDQILARADQLRYGAVYYWKVCAIASDGFEKPSEPRSFRVMP